MLTADLLLYTRRKGRIHPRLLDPGDAYLLDGAGAMVQLAEAHLGKRRGDLEPLLRGFPLKGPHPKTAAGLAKLLLQRCRFEVGWASPGGSDAPIDPVAPRGASPMQPSGASPGPMDPGGAGPGPEALRHRLFDLSAPVLSNLLGVAAVAQVNLRLHLSLIIGSELLTQVPVTRIIFLPCNGCYQEAVSGVPYRDKAPVICDLLVD